MKDASRFSPIIEFDEDSGMYTGEIDLPETDETVEYSHPDSARVARELQYAAAVAQRHGGDVDTDPEARAEQAASAIAEQDGVLQAYAVPEIHEVRVLLTHTETDTALGAIPEYAQFRLINHNLTIRRPTGLVLDLTYQLRPYAPPLPDEKTWEEIAESPTDVSDRSKLDRLATLHGECESDEWAVEDENICSGQPRIAGTDIVVYHVYYLIEEVGKSREQVYDLYPELSDGDVERAMEYCREREEAAEEYAREERKRVEQMDLGLGGE